MSACTMRLHAEEPWAQQSCWPEFELAMTVAGNMWQPYQTQRLSLSPFNNINTHRSSGPPEHNF